MPQLLTTQLYNTIEPLWASYLKHPFVKGIGEGTLAQEKFQHYLKQDYLFLMEYAKLFALGAAQAKDLETQTLFANLLHSLLNTEMALHRSYAARFGISPQALAATLPAATTLAYTSYMLSKATLGGIEYTVAAVLSCTWSYTYIGQALATWKNALTHDLYGPWIALYASDAFAALTQQCQNLINTFATQVSPEVRAELEEIVRYTSYFEYMFWDMSEQCSLWPLKI